PWSFFVIPLAVYLYHCRNRLESKGYLFPIVWFGAVFVFYSISESKRTVYLLPIYPAATLLLGAWWSELAGRTVRMPVAVERVLQLAGALMAVVVLAVVAVLLGERAGSGPLEWLTPLLHEKDAANLPAVQQMILSRFPVLAVWAAVLVPATGLFLWSVHRKRWVLVPVTLVGVVASSMAVVNGIFHPDIAWRRTFKPLMMVVREVSGSDDGLYFYRAFDYGAVFYSRRHIEPVHGELPVPPDDGRAYVLLWESEWEKLEPEARGRMELLRRSEGTGPKGRDRLIFALLKK
ncbi:MAG: hypothetical protein ACREQY_13345, partial [Candidatus Binatia bacterium]